MRLITLLSLLLLAASLLAQSSVSDQKYLGLHNLNFARNNNSSLEPVNGSPEVSLFNKSNQTQFSFGLFLRKVRTNGMYEQFDLLQIDWKKNTSFSEIHPHNMSFVVPLGEDKTQTLQALVGYQRGKLFSLAGKLQADIGARAFAVFNMLDQSPRTNQSFPSRQLSFGVGLNLEMGLQYTILKRLTIGYHVVPMSGRVFLQQTYIDNPVLPEEQRRDRGADSSGQFIKSLLDVRYIHLSYAL